jgi:hypothetical protein
MFRASSCPSSGATTTAVADWPDHYQQHCYHQAPTVNQRLLLMLLWLLMMGMRMPETCWAVSKWQVINLRSCCILLVDSVEYMMMHRLANPKCTLSRQAWWNTSLVTQGKSVWCHFIVSNLLQDGHLIVMLWFIEGMLVHVWQMYSVKQRVFRCIILQNICVMEKMLLKV